MNTDDRHDADGPLPEAERLKLHVLGPFALADRHGNHVTPRGQKAQALLALLALAPRGERTRVWLRDRLWSGSDPKKAANNLRQTVFELKRDLGKLVDAVLVISTTTIRLRQNRLWIDVVALNENPGLFHSLGLSSETELLEGLDIADEEFEDWLRTERTLWADKIELWADTVPQVQNAPAPTGHTAPSVEGLVQPLPRYGIGYLPNIQQGCDDKTGHLADYVLEGVARNLMELEPINVFDFRDSKVSSDELIGSFEVDYYVRVRTLQVGDAVTLTFFLYQAPQMILEWSQSIQATKTEIFSDDILLVLGFISQNVDRLAKSLFESRKDKGPDNGGGSKRIAYTALNQMFRVDQNAFQNSRALLDTAQNTQPDPLYAALQGYLMTFKLGQSCETLDQSDIEYTRAMVQDAIEANPFNSVTLSCLGHAIGYGLGDHHTAGELLEKAVRLNPSQAFVWDHYALHKLYTGQPEEAHLAAKRAVQLGSYSPLRFSYDTTLCMTSMMVGELGQAINAGRSALARQPHYTAAMRYLTASYGLAGRIEEARDIYDRLLIQDPQFEDPQVRRTRFRILDKDTENQVFTGLSGIGE